MTIFLIVAVAVVAFMVLFTTLVLGLCKHAAAGDQVVIVVDNTWPLPIAAGVGSERCPVCGDPTGVRCCEFGKDAA